ncbi:von Willebrand factor type A [Oceanithermus profundus DSM 14977]|uniref:von Willebrand factor type A n=1 Tax=Oceanithermus profundus (strain DSM 14977 / NBRC 100410 / VKM B-2274 / 506) TaxID=670487 RepID=E4U4K8_OCEP5|nr:VWA domain-containing protein [Oceanithermus profundus]ADR37001.1 von Willebrand factor type A [Oceanithermus profundus DSM 14977]
MGFEQPGFLFALALLFGVREPLLRLVVLLLVLGAAGPTLPLEHERTVVLIDQSPSAPAEASRIAAELAAPGTRFWAFAERAEPLPGPDARRNDLGRRTLVQPALDAVLAHAPDRIVLISDGLWSGRVYSPVPVYALHVAPRPNARIARLIAPAAPRLGETVEVRAVIESTEPTTARLSFQGGGTTTRYERRLPAGTSSVPYRFELERRTTVRVRLETPIGRDRAEVTLDPLGPGRVLVVDDPAAAAYLGAAGWTVTEGTPADLAEVPELLVIGGPAEAWNVADRARLERYLRQGGAALWTATPKGLFFGGWQRTLLAEKIPLEPEPQEGAALVLVLDVSGSMGLGAPSKLARAVEGARKLVDAAGPEDTLGIVTFASRSRWLLAPKAMTYRAKREAETRLDALEARGGTQLATAYAAAAEALEPLDARTRWILVLSDGQLEDDPQRTLARARQAAARGVKTLTLALGADADRPFLARLAREGGGRFLDLADPAALPQVLALLGEEAFKPPVVEGRFRLQLREHPVTQGLRELAPVPVLLPARAPGWAQVVVQTAAGRPLLTLGEVEGGRVAALATDLGRSWKDDPGAARLLAQLARWLTATPARPRYDWSTTDAGPVLWVYGRFDPLPLAQWAGRVEPLEPTAPFTFRLRLPRGFSGSVRVTSGDRTVFTVSAPKPSEWPAVDGAERLRELARDSGGAWLTEPAELPAPGRKPTPVGSYLWALALALFLLQRWRERAAHPKGVPEVG